MKIRFKIFISFLFTFFLYTPSNAQSKDIYIEEREWSLWNLEEFDFSIFNTVEQIILCNEASVEIGNDLGNQYCYHWEPKEDILNNSLPIQTVYPEGNITWIQYISDDNGNILQQNTYEIIYQSLEITHNPQYICSEGFPIELMATPGYLSYAWKNETTQEILSTTSTLSVSEFAEYSVEVLGLDNCTIKKTIDLRSHSIDVTFDPITDLCPGETRSLYPLITGEEEDYYFEWSTGETSFFIQIEPTETTTYSVTVTADAGCSATSDIQVDVFDEITASISPENPIICSDGGQTSTSLELENTDISYSYEWSTGETTDNISVDQAGTYDVTITDSNGCTLIDEVEVKDMSSDPQGLRNLFINKGFYEVDVAVNNLPGAPPGFAPSANYIHVTDYTNSLTEISFFNSANILIAEDLDDFLEDEMYAGFGTKAGYVTDNSSLCDNPELFDQLCEEFMTKDFSYWIHIWQESEGATAGKLLAICKTPASESLSPVDQEHRDFIAGNLNLVDNLNTPSNNFNSFSNQAVYTLVDNLAYNFVGDDLNSYFGTDFNAIRQNYEYECVYIENPTTFLSPAAVPVVIGNGAIARFGAIKNLDNIAYPGALTGFTNRLEPDNRIYKGKYRPKNLTDNDPNNDEDHFLGYKNTIDETYYEYYPTPFNPVPINDPIQITSGWRVGNQCPNKFYNLQDQFYVVNSGFQNPRGEGGFVFAPDPTAGDFGAGLPFNVRTIYTCLPYVNVNEYGLDWMVQIDTDNLNNSQLAYIVEMPIPGTNREEADDDDKFKIHITVQSPGPDEFLFTDYHIFNCSTGEWNEWDPNNQLAIPPEAMTMLEAMEDVIRILLQEYHIVLDFAGMVPGIGIGPDLINFVSYAIEGDPVNSGMSLLGALPIVGIVSTGTKYLVKFGDRIITTSITFIRIAGQLVPVSIDAFLGTMRALDYTTDEAATLLNWLYKNETALIAFYQRSQTQSSKIFDAWLRLQKGGADDALKFDLAKIEKLADDLNHPQYGDDLADLLNDRKEDVVDIWNKLKDDPFFNWEIKNDGAGFPPNSNWLKWSGRAFFKFVTQKGKDFENAISTIIRATDSGISPFNSWLDDGYQYHRQIHIKRTTSNPNIPNPTPGLPNPNDPLERIIVDDLFVKVEVDNVTGLPYNRAIYHDSKLSSTSPWTPNQRTELRKIFQDNANLDYIEFQVRTSEFPQGSIITQGSEVRIYRQDVWKTYSNDGSGVISNGGSGVINNATTEQQLF